MCHSVPRAARSGFGPPWSPNNQQALVPMAENQGGDRILSFFRDFSPDPCGDPDAGVPATSAEFVSLAREVVPGALEKSEMNRRMFLQAGLGATAAASGLAVTPAQAQEFADQKPRVGLIG